MKIVWVLESLELSGGVGVVVRTAEGLARRGHDVSIVTKDARHDWIAVRVPIVEVPRFDASTLPEADVHVATWFPTVVPTARARRSGKVFHLSQGYEALLPHLAPRRDEIDAAYREPIPKILISPHLRRHLEGRFPGPFHVIPQSVDAAAFRPRGTDPAGPSTLPAVGLVGPFLAETKGIRVALRAVARLRREGRPLRLHRVSHLPEEKDEAAITPIDSYLCSLRAAGMPGWYHALDLLLFPAFDAEGFGLPPLEAMAAGVPVVITDIPSLAVLPVDAVSRVPQGDDAAMAREAARLLDDPGLWRARRKRGLEVATNFALEPVLDGLEAIFGS